MKKLIFTFFLFLLFTAQSWSQVLELQQQLNNTTTDTTQARLMYELAWELKESDRVASTNYVDQAYKIAMDNHLQVLVINCIQLKGMLERYLGNYQQALTYCQQALKLSRENNNPTLFTSSLYEIGNTYYKLADYKNSIHYYDYALKIAILTGNNNMKMKALGKKAYVLDMQGKFYEAIECYYKALQVGLYADDKKALAGIKANLGFLHTILGNFKEAIKLNQEARVMYQKLNDQVGVAQTIGNMASIDFATENLQSALTGYQTALKIYEKLQHQEGIQAGMNNIAGVLGSMGRFDESIVWMKKAMTVAKKNKDKKGVTKGYVNLSDIYLMKGDYKLAVQYGDTGKIASMEMGLLHELWHAYNNIYRANEAMGNYKGAFENFQQFMLLRDSMYSMDVAKKTGELEIKYQVEVKQKQLELLEEQDKVKSLQVKQKNYLIFALAGGLLFILGLVIIVIVILVSRAQKKEAVFLRKKAELEQQALRSQMNPHFIFNSLNSIQRLYVEGKMAKANEYMADFSTLMRKILDNSTRNKITVKEELTTLQLYLEIEKLRCGELLEYKMNIDPEIDVLNTHIPPMLIQPFVENAIWHGILPKKEKGTVKINLQKTEQGLVCIIEDDGVGLSNKTGNHEPMGIKLTEQRLNTKVKVEHLSPGTRFSFIISI